MLLLDNIKIYEDLDNEKVIRKALYKNRIDNDDVISSKIIKKSIDSRDKNNVHYNYSIRVEVKNENKYPKIKRLKEIDKIKINKNRKSVYEPIIVGAGPAGLFTAITLVRNGYKPIIIEQGSSVEDRKEIIDLYRNQAKINTKCNVQFGEGGAGTFSDG